MRTVIGGRDLTDVIRTPQASMDASTVSQVGAVRAALVELQRQMGSGGGIVMEGRDIGTVVFPEAELKVFLSASSRVRGKRRWAQLKEQGGDRELESVISEVRQRDLKDSTRGISPLRPAADAVVFDSSQLGIDRVLRSILRMVEARVEGRELPSPSVADSPVPPRGG